MVKAIIFDCFGVLTTDLWKEFCATLPSDEIVQKAKDLNHQYDAGMIAFDPFIKEVSEVTKRNPEVIKAIFTNEDSEKNDRLLNYIKELKTKYKTGILSNVATNWVVDYFLTPDEQKLFDTMVFSFQLGVGKPDSQVYKEVLTRLGVEPHEAIFIDDNERYCAAAEALGIKAVLYQDFEQMKRELEELLAVTDN